MQIVFYASGFSLIKITCFPLIFFYFSFKKSRAIQKNIFICNEIFRLWKRYDKPMVDSNVSQSGGASSDDVQQFAILHGAVKYLHFDINGENRDDVLTYLTHLCVRMQRTQRTLLRKQICLSLMAIFQSISPLNASTSLMDENAREEDEGDLFLLDDIGDEIVALHRATLAHTASNRQLFSAFRSNKTEEDDIKTPMPSDYEEKGDESFGFPHLVFLFFCFSVLMFLFLHIGCTKTEGKR